MNEKVKQELRNNILELLFGMTSHYPPNTEYAIDAPKGVKTNTAPLYVEHGRVGNISLSFDDRDKIVYLHGGFRKDDGAYPIVKAWSAYFFGINEIAEEIIQFLLKD